jgi:hypothetical protein
MHSASQAIQHLVAFADSKLADGTMAHSRLLLPTFRRLGRWAAGVFEHEDGDVEQNAGLDTSVNFVYLGDGYNKRKDPEHLPATNLWERFGNVVRMIPKFLASEQSVFGFRAACATMTVGIVAFLENTRVFFLEQRLVWALIFIAIGMTMSEYARGLAYAGERQVG